MKIEHGMSMEEDAGRGKRWPQGTRKTTKRPVKIWNQEIQNQAFYSSRVSACFRGDCPSSFNIPCSTSFGSRGGWGHRVVGFAAAGPSVVIVAEAGWIDPDVYSGLYDKAGKLNARELPVCVNT